MNNNILHKLFLTLTLVLLTLGASAQVTVSGNVSDESGEPIIGATVMEALTTNGVVTDFDGNFKIQVKNENATLKISYIGMVAQNIRVGNQRNIKVVLKDESQKINEVVVVGYGHQKKESVVGAISQVSSDDLLNTPTANVTQAIAGKIPGVVTTQVSGAPGADDATINIRGRATFAGDGAPLVMVDGVERAFSQVAPDDIESISVLKDASATAVYGVRGANGVILVTTKRGKDMKPEVSLTSNFMWGTPTRKPHYLNSYDSVTLLEEALKNDGLPSQYSASDIEMYRKSCAGELTGADALLYPNVDWYDEVLNNWAPSQRYNVSVRGGTKRMRYYVSGEMYNQGSLIKNLSQDAYGNSSSPGYNRYAFRANMDFFLSKDLTFPVYVNGKPVINEESGYTEQNMWKNRDPRLAATILYNGCEWGQATSTKTNVIDVVYGHRDNPIGNQNATPTGYYVRKYIPETILSSNHSGTAKRLWKIFTYSELLLNYAEALNEADYAGNKTQVCNLLDQIRHRGGIIGNVADRTDLNSQSAMRNFIHKERTIELAFEEHRWWDVRRWNVAGDALGRDIYGVNVAADGTITRKVAQQRKWQDKFYLYPIPEAEVWKIGQDFQNDGWKE